MQESLSHLGFKCLCTLWGLYTIAQTNTMLEQREKQNKILEEINKKLNPKDK